jgi:hypothetical protein
MHGAFFFCVEVLTVLTALRNTNHIAVTSDSFTVNQISLLLHAIEEERKQAS